MASGYPRRFGAYVLLERLGVGGMSEVDLARRASDPDEYVRLVVVKRIKADRHEDASFVRMFRDEARITSQLHHQNIAQLFDFGRVGDEYFLALEYIPGIDLRDVLNAVTNAGKRLPMRVVLTVVCQVLAALHYAHSRVDNVGRSMNIVHRDVNPRNIMMSTRGEVKLIDFGVAKAEDRLEHTRTDHVKGKFAYMAPEQVDGTGIDQRADVFAMGLTLYEMVTGQGAFAGLSQVQILHKLLSTRVPSLPTAPDVPQALREVHRLATHPDKESRYATAEAMRQDLEKVAASLGGLCSPTEMVHFLRQLDPKIEARLQDKITTYSGPLSVPEDSTDALPVRSLFTEEVTKPVPAPKAPLAPLPTAPPPSDSSSSGTRVAQIGIAMGGAAAAILAVVVVAAVVGIVALAATWDSSQPSSPDAQAGSAEPTDTAAPEPLPEPSPVTHPAPVDVHTPIPSPVAEPPPAPEPATPQPQARPEPGTPEPRVTQPEPATPVPEVEPDTAVVVPEPVVVQPAPVATEPEPAVPEPVAESGTVQVTSSPRGLAVFVDGVDTGQVTPARIVVPVGAHQVHVDGFAAKTVSVGNGLVSNVLFR